MLTLTNSMNYNSCMINSNTKRTDVIIYPQHIIDIHSHWRWNGICRMSCSTVR
ncbi:unnamed protein product [Schistosoma mattheei]|uniref:Uncharacterized protein n=1 Tax=Schistosoma mattheei TaxID=31246 RepID=A0A183NRB6_9TREM|nr:unnamed protein product [Schistosoma mattheei]